MPINPLPALDRTSATFRDDVDNFFANTLPVFSVDFSAAAAALNLNATNDTSVTSNAIGTGQKIFTASPNKSFWPGMYLVIADSANPATNSMVGQVISYASVTGQLVVSVTNVNGAGTKTAWSISQSISLGSENTANKDAAGGYVGKTLEKLNIWNTARTFMSFLFHAATTVRSWQLPDKSGTVALTDDVFGKNRIINGSMVVDERNNGASKTFAAGGALAYCVDRFYGYCTGANVTAQQVNLANRQKRYRFTGATSVTGVGFGQRIEAVNCLDLAGSTATLQCKLSSSSLTSLGWAAYYANTADIFGTLAAPTRTLIASGNFTINSTEAIYTTQIPIPAAAMTGIEIVLTGGALLASQTLTIGDIQLESGIVATDFEFRHYAHELALCQCYYEKITVPPFFLAGPSCTQYYGPGIYFNSSKRVDPSISLPSATNIAFTTVGALLTPTVWQVIGLSTIGFAMNVGYSAAFGGYSSFTATASAEL
ncbi:hypothetical protein [Methylobacter sp.]|uniref:hypothetical protein n=1 Tax=Methylobacter sp. TaxID=2051955 RepID=UPI0024872DB9|nr:hypothetical protein [Methylobacter sp.]MDI1278077.1 hypothetical protein [Methylobacter sp.]